MNRNRTNRTKWSGFGVVLALVAALGAAGAMAQGTIVDIGSNRLGTGGTSGNAFPMNNVNGTFLHVWPKTQILNTVTNAPVNGDILEFGWVYTGSFAAKTWPNIKIWFGETTNIDTSLSSTFLANFNTTVPPLLAYDGPMTISNYVAQSFHRVPMMNHFNYTGVNNLAIYIEIVGGSSSPSTTLGIWQNNLGNGRVFNSSVAASPTGTVGTNYGHGASFSILEQVQGNSIRVTGADVQGGVLQIGSNTVTATLNNNGTNAYSNTPIPMEYSTDGGVTWVGAQSMIFPSFPPLSNQTATFTLPWVVSTFAQRELRVRITPPAIGPGDQMKMKTFTPDLDITAVTTSVAPALNTPLSVGFTVRNNGSFTHNGQAFAAQYTIDGGVTWVPGSFTPATLAATNNTETFTFSSPFLLASAGTYNLQVRINPQVGGDPDTTDTMTLVLRNVGVPYITFAPTAGIATGTLGPPIYRSSSTTTPGYISITQMIYTSAQLTGLTANSVISNIAFNKTNLHQSAPGRTHALRVWLGNTTSTTFTASATYADFASGQQLVHSDNAWVLPGPTGWIDFGPFNQSTPFIYAGDNLIVTVEFDALGQTAPVTVPGTDAATSPAWHYETVSMTGASRGQQISVGPPVSPTQVVSLNGLSTSTRRPHMQVYYSAPTATDLDVADIKFGTTTLVNEPAVGNNTVNAVVRSMGTGGYTGSFTVGYSVDGVTWVDQPFTASGLVSIGSTQTVQFTTPWNIASLGSTSLRVRISPQVTGDPDPVDVLVRPYVVDADVDAVLYSGSIISLNQPITVRARIKNNGLFNLNNTALILRYTSNGGTSWTQQPFTATSLAANGDTQIFDFTVPTSFQTAGNYTVTVEVSPALAGDPDTLDTASLALNDVGNPVVNVGAADFPGASGGSNTIPMTYATSAYMSGWHPQQLRNVSGNITEFGLQYASVSTKTFTNLKITLGETNMPVQGGFTLSTPFLSYMNVGTPVVVFDGPSSLTTTTVGQYVRWTLQQPYNYSGQNVLLYLIEFTSPATGGPSLQIYSGGSVNIPRYYNSTGANLGTSQTLNYSSGASFYFIQPANVDLDVKSVGYSSVTPAPATLNSGPGVGTNFVTATIESFGMLPFTGNFTAGYSVNNGAWVDQQFTASGLTGIGTSQQVTFTTPFTVASPLSAQTVKVRIFPQATGDPDISDEMTFSYTTIDADLVQIRAPGPFLGMNNVVVRVKNSGNLSLNGQPISIRYSIDNGASFGTPQSFTPTTLGGLDSFQDFTFTTQWNLQSIGSYTLVAEIFPPLAGDPDTLDTVSVTYAEAGGAFEALVGFPETSSGGGSNAGYPLNTWYHDMRMESLYLASELADVGLYASASINAIKLKVAEVPGMDLSDFRIRLMHFSPNAHPGSYQTSGYTNCFGPTLVTMASLTVNQWRTFTFATPFVWNGVDNVLIDITHDNTNYITGGGCYLRTVPGPNRSLRGFSDSGYTWPFDLMTNAGAATFVPSVRFEFPPPSNPGLAVSRGTVNVQDTTTDSLGDTIYATLNQNLTYTCMNFGLSNALNITAVNITGVTNCLATIVTNPAGTPISSQQTSNLVINVAPNAGPYSFNVELTNNSEMLTLQSYTFTVSGNGFVNTAPEVPLPLASGGKSILITEVSSDQSTLPSTGSEYFEITNVGTQPVSLSGWHVFIYEGTVTTPYSPYPVTLPGTLPMIPGGGVFNFVDSGTPVGAGHSLGANILWNGGASGGVVLVDAQSNIVDAVFWGTINPAQVSIPVPGGPTLSVGTQWSGPACNFTTVFQSSMSRTGTLDNDNASDWSQATGHSIGVLNTGLIVPFGGGELQVTGVSPNYLVETVVGANLALALLVTDPDAGHSITATLNTAAGGTITAAQAGFTNTFPMALGPAASPLIFVLQGTAAMAGTVNFTISAGDNGTIPATSVTNIQVKIGARTDLTAMNLDTTFERVNGTKDVYRGEQDLDIDMTIKNDNNFAVQVNAINFLVLDAANEQPVSGFTFSLVGGPVTVPASSTAGVPLVVKMSVDANAGGTNGMTCILRINSGDIVDPQNPTTNPIVLKIDAAALEDEFDLYDGPVPAPMAITMTGFNPVVETVPFLQNLTVTGGTGQYTWSIPTTSASQLPAGLTLDPAGSTFLDAKIFGQAATGSSSAPLNPYIITLSVTDGAYVDTETFVMTVNTFTALSFPVFTLANGMEYEPYVMTAPMAATGGSLIYNYSVDATSTDQLPAGLTLNPATGVISGIPADGTQDNYSITFQVDDGQTQLTQTVSLTIEPHVLEWRGTTLPAGEETVAYSALLDAIGGTGARVYSIESGTLPAGLTLTGTTGAISGVPAVNSSGTYNVTFKVTDVLNTSVNQAITITITLPPPLTITTNELMYAQVGTAYSQTIDATGGSRNYTFAFATGAVVPGSVTLSPSGQLTGTPAFAQDGRYPVDIVVNDGFGTSTKAFVFNVLSPDADSVVISEVDTGTGYIELTHVGQFPVNLSGWHLTVWVDGNTPLSLPFSALPGATLALPTEVAKFTIGGTAGGFWPNYSTGGSWTVTATSSIAVMLSNGAGTVIDMVKIGNVNVATLVDAANNPVDVPSAMAAEAALTSGSANYSLGANGFAGSAAGTPGAYNPGLPTVPLFLLKDNIRETVEGETYLDFVVAAGGTAPYTYSITAPTASWLSINPATGDLTGTVPASSAGTVSVDVTVTDAALGSVTETISLDILAATAPVAVTYAVSMTAEGQSFGGTIIDVPVTMTKAAGAPDIEGFGFIIELPASTAAELDVLDVVPGAATLSAGRTVVARDLGNNSVFVGDMEGAVATTIDSGVIAIVRFIVPGPSTFVAPEAVYPVNIAHVEVGNAGTQVRAQGTNGQMTLSNYAPQDVNRDDAIDVVDVQLAVNLILQLTQPTYPGQGDANEDSNVDVVDVQTIVNCILFGGC